MHAPAANDAAACNTAPAMISALLTVGLYFRSDIKDIDYMR